MPAELETFIMAMIPIGELRASIPFAVEARGMSRTLAYIISVLGNMVPVVFIFLLLEPVVNFFSKQFKLIEKIINFVFEKTKRDNEEKVKKWGYLALAGFTAIPLPVSGAWTASLVAYLFGLDYKKSFLSIFAGVLVAGLVIISLLQFSGFFKGVSPIEMVLAFLFLGLIFHYLLKNKK